MKPGSARVLAAVSGLLLAASFAPASAGGLAWVALTPLFLALLASPGPGFSFSLGAITGAVFYILSLIWMANAVHYLALAFWAVFLLWTALHAALLRGIWELRDYRGRLTAGRAFFWVAAAGLTWTGIEYFRSELWPLECPWLALGYSQTFVPPLFQSLSVVGVYGLSAFIVSANAAWALALWRRSYSPAAFFLAALAASALWGNDRLHSFPADAGRPVKVALVQAERADIDRLAAYSLSPEAADADLLVWPECSVFMPEPQSPSYISLLSEKLAPSRAEAVIGVCVAPDPARGIERANFTLHLGRDKKPAGRYEKMHPVQFVEAGLPSNREPRPVDTPLGRLGPQICYDLAFEDGSRLMAREGAEILITPTLDPREWSILQHRQHSDMTAARAVETGLWAVRAASSGESQVIDSTGRLRARLKSPKRGVLTAVARLAPGGTFYTRAGWLLAPLAFLFTLAVSALVIFKRRI